VVSTGTWVVNFAVGGDLDHLDPARDTLANVDAYGRAIPSARFMGGREFEALTAELGVLDQQAALEAMPTAIARRIMLLPNTAEGSGPFPGRQAQWLNVDEASPADRWAGACLYLALMTQTCLDLIGADGPIMVEGPFSHNAAFLTALASLTRRDVLAVHGSSGTCQGAALLAGVTPAPRTNTQFAPAEIEGLVTYAEIWGSLARGAGTLMPPKTVPWNPKSLSQPSP
jgi:sugar (pentulose or hexulose) kinase